MPGKNNTPHAGTVRGVENRLTSPQSTDAARLAHLNTRVLAGCLSCARRLTDPRSIARGFGPVCFTREANRQRHERAEAIHGRLWGLLRRLPSLDVRELALVSAALDDAVDALTGLEVAR